MTEAQVADPRRKLDPGPLLRVNEVFHSFQGEGPSTGRACTFLRLTGCNLDCAWCDTPYTWDWTGHNGTAYDKAEETHVRTVGEMAAYLYVPLEVAPLLVITGGEPLLQQGAIVGLVDALRRQGWQGRIEVETNGTRPPDVALRGRVYFNVSPKLPSARTTKDPIRTEALAALAANRAIFKFVMTNDGEDIEAIELLLRRVGNIRSHQVWLMPEGRDRETIEAGLSVLAEPARKRGWNLSSRLHVVMWGDERGR